MAHQRKLAAVLDVPVPVQRLYARLRPADGALLEDAAVGLGVSTAQLLTDLAPLLERGVVRVDRGVLRVLSPAEVLAVQVQAESRTLQETVVRLTRIAKAVPQVGEELPRGDDGEHDWVDADVVVGGSVTDLLVPWIEQSQGDLRLMRPDQWQMPTESLMFAAVQGALQQGREVRTIYPVRALQEAPQVLRDRAALGEQVRVLTEVPTRLAVVGTSRALVPDPPGTANDRRIVMRHPGIIVLLADYFDLLWERAVTVPALTGPAGERVERRLLLAELRRGSRDEQVARALGVSLRTVRRRIAELMIELGADTRFEAGVEAARRGWL